MNDSGCEKCGTYICMGNCDGEIPVKEIDENATDISREEAIETLGDREAEIGCQNLSTLHDGLADIYKNGIKGFKDKSNHELRVAYLDIINCYFTGQITGEKEP